MNNWNFVQWHHHWKLFEQLSLRSHPRNVLHIEAQLNLKISVEPGSGRKTAAIHHFMRVFRSRPSSQEPFKMWRWRKWVSWESHWQPWFLACFFLRHVGAKEQKIGHASMKMVFLVEANSVSFMTPLAPLANKSSKMARIKKTVKEAMCQKQYLQGEVFIHLVSFPEAAETKKIVASKFRSFYRQRTFLNGDSFGSGKGGRVSHNHRSICMWHRNGDHWYG